MNVWCMGADCEDMHATCHKACSSSATPLATCHMHANIKHAEQIEHA
jgi:hypothetical protein